MGMGSTRGMGSTMGVGSTTDDDEEEPKKVTYRPVSSTPVKRFFFTVICSQISTF